MAAVEQGEVSMERLDTMAGRMLLLMERTRAFEEPLDHPEESVDRPEHRAEVLESVHSLLSRRSDYAGWWIRAAYLNAARGRRDAAKLAM